MKKLLLDLVCLGELCNFRCRYCTGEKTSLVLDERATQQAKKNLDRVLGAVEDSFLVYRFSGGEVFLSEETVSMLLERSFPITQFLTNGTLLSETMVDKLWKAKDRVVVCVSLDGHTLEMNRMRESPSGMKEENMRLILDHILLLVSKGVPVEIQTVLSPANCDSLTSYLDFVVDSYPTENLMVSVFPVRPLPRGLRVAGIEKAIGNYEKYREILPSRDYMVGLLHSISEKRMSTCNVPRHISFKVVQKGFSPECEVRDYFCECGGLRYYYGRHCAACYTHYDLYNSILEGRTDLAAIPFPLFRHPLIRSYFEDAEKVRRRDMISQLVSYGKSKLLGNSFS